jgi:kynurenine formamidase
MEVTDLTQVLMSGMPVFPGSDPARMMQVSDFDKDGYNEIRLDLSTHTGTHIDCKKHIFREGFNTTAPAARFTGRGLIISCLNLDSPKEIGIVHVKKFEQKLRQVDFVLLHTGWNKYWGLGQYFADFPVLSEEAALYLTGFSLKGVGIDAPSFDPVISSVLPVHKMLLSHDILLIENLTDLENIPSGDFLFCCFPLKISEGDGSPVRAVAIGLNLTAKQNGPEYLLP